MGAVYEGRSDDGEIVAIKVVQGPTTPSLVRRLTREGELIERIRHPNVVSVMDFGSSQDGAYIVMELLDGEPLSRVLVREKRLSVARIVEVFLPILSAVAAIHQATVIHRDIKPANIMLARRGRARDEPVLLDFGISKSFDSSLSDDSGVTRSHSILGTLAYLSPEQTLNARAVSIFSDQYALGVMLYEAATGRRPFLGSSQYEMMHAILHDRVPLPSEVVPDLPAALDAIVLRAMNRDVAARYPSVHALARDLLSVAEPSVREHWLAEFAHSPDDTEAVDRTLVDERSRPQVTRGAGAKVRIRMAAVGIALAVAAIVMAQWSPNAVERRAVREPIRIREELTEAPTPEPPATSPTLPPPVRDLANERFVSAAPALSASAARRTQRTRRASVARARSAASPTALTKPPEPALNEDDAIDPFAPVAR